MPTSAGFQTRAEELVINPEIGMLRDTLEADADAFASKMRQSGYRGSKPNKIITSTSFHQRRARRSYHDITYSELLCWELDEVAYLLTCVGQIAKLGLVHDDEDGRTITTKPRHGVSYYAGGWMIIPIEHIPVNDLPKLIKAINQL